MSDTAAPASGLIGPNAILQLLPVIDRFGGQARVRELLDHAGISDVPDGHSMIPEGQAARLHRQLRLEEPAHAPALSAQAGLMTADYIMAHRIPKPVQWILRALPPALAARALSRAINRHAWTFAGSGRFGVIDPWTFEITNNPLIEGEVNTTCLCHWHAAVFARLYSTLVSSRCHCTEVDCGCRADNAICRFEIVRY